ncbi:MAG: hypothetical protein EPO55_14220 [Reyranella sp.]|nr:MAG: hypothetical protein EPO55_14220 [Reyranella sp.]
MMIESAETVASTESAETNPGTVRARWLGAIRAVAYWGLWLFLISIFLASAGDIWDYNEDPTPYHRVYRDAVLHEYVMWAYLVLTAAAIPFQVAGWRERRFSPVAVAVFALHVCFAVANRMFGIIQTCCS